MFQTTGTFHFPTIPVINMSSFLRAISQEQLLHYYVERWKIHPDTLSIIDWGIFSQVMNKIPPNIKRFVSKTSGTWIPTNSHLNKIEGTNKNCPICNKSEETQKHMYECTNKKEQKHTKTLKKKLEKAKTNPVIIKILSQMLASPEDQEQDKKWHPNIKEAHQEQCEIGILKLYHGKLALGWTTAQQVYIARNNISNPTRNWPYVVINNIIIYTHSIWNERNQINNDTIHRNPATHPNKVNAIIKDLHKQDTKTLLPHDAHLFQKTET